MGFMSSIVSRRPLVLNQSKDSVWTAIRLGTSRIWDNLEKDLRGLGVFLSPKGDHSSHPGVCAQGSTRKLVYYHSALYATSPIGARSFSGSRPGYRKSPRERGASRKA